MKGFPSLIDELDDNIIELDSDFVIRKVNTSFVRHLQSAGSTIEPIGKKLFEVLPVAADLMHYFDDVFQSGDMIQFERKSPNPTVNKLFMITLLPIKNTMKDVIGILFTSHEIR